MELVLIAMILMYGVYRLGNPEETIKYGGVVNGKHKYIRNDGKVLYCRHCHIDDNDEIDYEDFYYYHLNELCWEDD